MKLSNEHPAHPDWVDPFDRRYVKSMAQAILSPLAHRYFHAEMHGFENLPTRPNPDKPLLCQQPFWHGLSLGCDCLREPLA